MDSMLDNDHLFKGKVVAFIMVMVTNYSKIVLDVFCGSGVLSVLAAKVAQFYLIRVPS